MLKQTLYIALAAILLTGCGKQIPTEYKQAQTLPDIYPDYTNVTVPVNIAPLTFQMDKHADDMVARLTAGDVEVVCGGEKVQPSKNEWQRLIAQALGKAISVEVYARYGEQWTRYKPFSILVSADKIDPYISYRLIPPSYVGYEDLFISQRCLENYDESVIYSNMLCSKEASGQCINCHHYQNYNPQRMQFHARQYQGGTVMARDGKIKKINMRNDSILSAGVYPAWHPTLDLIVYSTNKTHQTFHTTDANKIEVFDEASDLIAYDISKNEVTNIEKRKDEFEVFPAWSPDGKWLYYCSAHFEMPEEVKDGAVEVISRAYEVKYSIYRKAFNPQTMEFGEREIVFDAAAMDMSATLPRVSPDGRFLMFTLGKFGVFHIWHHDADLWLMDLATAQARPMKEINSKDTESYHSWSSNGRWVVFSSRRYDANFTRPFIAHIDKNGRGSKPFELPSEDPDYHRQFMKCYNIPEFMSGPVSIKPQQFADILKTDGEPVKYVRKLGAPQPPSKGK
ncbi:MAG: PD40 domain-containing protein [Prevotella sp.]|nr:PD40 domain-containing protein [Prevotella sp.]